MDTLGSSHPLCGTIAKSALKAQSSLEKMFSEQRLTALETKSAWSSLSVNVACLQSVRYIIDHAQCAIGPSYGFLFSWNVSRRKQTDLVISA